MKDDWLRRDRNHYRQLPFQPDPRLCWMVLPPFALASFWLSPAGAQWVRSGCALPNKYAILRASTTRPLKPQGDLTGLIES